LNTPIESKSQAESQGQTQERALTTTSYAVLAVLSLRDHSTYDLIRQMRLSMHYMWPRAESNVYAEPRRLVQAGLATAREEWNGQRRRTVYSITRAGRAALADWIASPSARPRHENEALVKVMFAENGTRDDLLKSIRELADDAEAGVRHFREIADRYAANRGEYPHRFGLSGLALRLAAEQQAATLRWARWAEQVVAGWDSPLAADAAWGVDALRAAGEPLATDDDPVREMLA
jgi:PadR family transcriptional regulator, regulatory protein AphA